MDKMLGHWKEVYFPMFNFVVAKLWRRYVVAQSVMASAVEMNACIAFAGGLKQINGVCTNVSDVDTLLQELFINTLLST